MKVLVSGATGLIGSTLVSAWRTQAHRVWTLVRDPSRAGPNVILWAPPDRGPDPAAIEGLDAVVHLAGASIADGRWTEARKAELRASRIGTTRLLADTLARLKNPPKTWICASAIGYYGDRGDTPLTETSARGSGFIADLCAEWEAAAEPARRQGIRVAHLRTGIVLSRQGGALPPLARPFFCGLGGPLGSGRQVMSWITLEDVCGAIRHVLISPKLQGPINLTAPQPVTNAEFSRTLAHVLHRPAFMRVPAPAIQMMWGREKADALLLSGAYVQPAVLESSGYRFLFPDLRGALRHLFRV